MPPVSVGTLHSPSPKTVVPVGEGLMRLTGDSILTASLVEDGVDTYRRLFGDAWASRIMRENHAAVQIGVVARRGDSRTKPGHERSNNRGISSACR